jgi:DNA-binding beta-propeller fold protein YncE
MTKMAVKSILTGTLFFLCASVFAQTSPRQANTGMSTEEYEEIIMNLPLFSEVIDNWTRKSVEGDIAKTYTKMRTVKTFPKGEQVVFPKKGDMIVYQLTGLSYDNPFNRPKDERITSKSTRIVAIDAKTKEILAWKELPLELKGNPHTTPVTPDGQYIWAGGPPLTNFEDIELDESMTDNTGCTSPVCSMIPTTLVKIDALTLEAVKVVTAPGRLHHGHVFRDKYLVFDTFVRDADGVDTYLVDPATDTVIAGIRDDELGGSSYTVWNDQDDEYLYQLMEPKGYGNRKVFDGYISAHWIRMQNFTALRPFWISKIRVSDDLKEMEVVREYPYFGYRANWVEVSSDKKYFYTTPSGMNIACKINMETGQKVWCTPVGDGPYGCELNADESELWVANKGETTDMWGNDMTIIDTRSGIRKGLINTGFTTDHIILSPDGKEMWTSANGSGKLFVYDAETREQKAVIPLPGFGDPHGVPFVYYDEDDKARLVNDQHGFHNGVNPRTGNALVY